MDERKSGYLEIRVQDIRKSEYQTRAAQRFAEEHENLYAAGVLIRYPAMLIPTT
jgi:hypothetical protein